MKNKFLLVLLIFMSLNAWTNAQRHEIGISLGQPNLIADIGKTNFIQFKADGANTPISIGMLYRYNLNNRQSLRFNLSYNKVFFDDNEASEGYRIDRKLSGMNNIIEASLLFEYYFFDINNIQNFASSPYIFAGLGVFTHKNPKYTINHQLIKNSDGTYKPPMNSSDFESSIEKSTSTKLDVSIPFGIGYKFKFNYNWLLGFEIGARYTTQNNLDYSNLADKNFTSNIDPRLLQQGNLSSSIQEEINKRNSDIKESYQTGNTFKSNDWYLVWGVNLTYTFGRPPCLCN
ncbi:hypothetical protein ETU08_05430 [Apibacter muscae]|uniref:DUF6089 domain-containing protein n=1 Tax=Apibacter muscae TaxID=2509004 RepID=A0A563DF96_9FLAO|nr:DUF6089 family protein [Apibacter muscae]TWP28747.1 hypothetical protein ETU09_05375 [Apibacter muscae]TWP30001.1 hypothetical protein ETU08_05430 [Apibacter muscae]